MNIEVLGMELKVLARLGGGTYLVAHPNGPAMTNGSSICTLSFNADVEQETLRDKAIARYVEMSWPIVAKQLEGNAPDVGGHPKLP